MIETLSRTHLLIGTSRCLELSGIQNVVEDVVVKLRSNGWFWVGAIAACLEGIDGNHR